MAFLEPIGNQFVAYTLGSLFSLLYGREPNAFKFALELVFSK